MLSNKVIDYLNKQGVYSEKEDHLFEGLEFLDYFLPQDVVRRLKMTEIFKNLDS